MTDTYNHITINIPGKNYPIYIDEDIEISDLFNDSAVKKYLIIAEKLAELQSPKIQKITESLNAYTFFISDNESDKSLVNAEKIYHWLIDNHVDRHSMIIGIGGGVVCDLAGFCAATILRGIDLVLIPSTLLAQVDAAIGGKNGVNSSQAKNMVGTIYQPKTVICDVDYLSSLPDRQYSSGLAEVVKHGFIYDPKLLETVKKNWPIPNLPSHKIVELITSAALIKAEVVAKDETENGLRRILNFGHTLGHMLESYHDYRFTHGEAVIAGIKFALFLSTKLTGLSQAQYKDGLDCLQLFQNQVPYPQLDPASFADALSKDKKTIAENVNFVLLKEIGKTEIVQIPIIELYNYYKKFIASP